jgi:prolyl oligopeptidase
LQWTLFYEEPAIFDLSDIEGKIVFYPSKDGTKVPMFIVHKKDINLNGANPTLLYGYGGFNVGIEPSFIGTFASFVKRGGIYAVAGLRGGDEYGENWHKAGMLKNKQNTFDDFFAAAEYLFNEKYTSSKNLVVYGGSNGGLLIGATLTQRPDICNAAICGVPLLDMARFHKFLIARYWIPEYGDPDNEEDLRYILTYSPYHNIKNNVNYPTTIVTAGENDTRVDPLHAKKFVAAMQARPEQKNPIFLHMEFDSGHGSGKPIAREIEEAEKRITYILRYGGYKGN